MTFSNSIVDGDISNDPIVGHIRARVHISKLSRGGTSLQRQREWWWLGVCYLASDIIGTLLHQVTVEGVL